jgi:protein gp37
MSEKSAISWTQATWNPVVGCSKISTGCANCYAERLALRYGWTPKTWSHNNAKDNVQLKPGKLDLPLKWKEPKMIFVNSMSDLFHEQVPDYFIQDVFKVMAKARWHTFQVLTKRHARMAAFRPATPDGQWPENVWAMVSVENQEWADHRCPELLKVNAKVRGLSCEPLLGPMDLRPYLNGLQWVIVGGESGPGYRKMELDWARAIRDQCKAAGVPFFYKQGNHLRPGMDRELDGRLWEEFPDGQ